MTQPDIYRQKDAQYHFQTYKRYPLTLVKGRGHEVWDQDNKRYIDAFGGISVHNIGHCHPKVSEAIREQSKTLMHVSNFFTSPSQAMLSEQLCMLSGMERVFLCNSGAEAVEGAVKLSRKYAWEKHRKNGTILSFTGCFHGRTLATTALGKQKFLDAFKPVPGGFEQLPFNEKEALRKAFEEHDVIGVIVELIQGEGGIHVANESFIAEISRLCRQHDAQLITDQVQCGLGRSGKMFTHHYYEGLRPDIITNAKALGGGFPIGSILARQNVAEQLTYGEHGTTFGGNPLACAAALATLKVMNEEDLARRSQQKGREILNWLKEETTGNEKVKEVRGKGLMLGVELTFPAQPVLERMREKGILVNVTAENTVRFLPPLNTPDEALNHIFEVFLDTLNELQPE